MVPRPTQRVGGLRVLAYENRENASFHRMVSETAAATGLPVTIGAIAPASRRNLMSGDRERWLRGVLPTVRERLVLNVDATDALLLCTAEELSRKYDALAGSSSDLVVGGEVRAWPRYFRYEGVSIYRNMRSANATAYPARPDGMNGVLPRYVNIGTILGPARSYAKMLECMHEARALRA
ncbi:hypothetical protein EMIHUDRAFT_313414 [Emiliania huxleyi CCMP1516]|uniref:Uncharacterized protein n=2 Tax=Emiliania huxleyi TaxID=2903 RepID=A0A0D3KL77_EMIH1|nr:hypothetical protein EMIHUDRAFT_313414 [Emiliania huxleyi CCMP1516]EOD36512.1 hypothetical protein EMIHUDRAFT_313414 [Emiliania huxleyi CCMP1516]|eukprot:XP_005788941.1 hypothetical protein EMIHUDRAFT_313414 [Emiliania huxleyi CCMP1516]